MISVEGTDMEGGGIGLKNEVWEAAKPIVEQWTGMELKPTSQYGIRIYTEGAILNPHADRRKYGGKTVNPISAPPCMKTNFCIECLYLQSHSLALA